MKKVVGALLAFAGTLGILAWWGLGIAMYVNRYEGFPQLLGILFVPSLALPFFKKLSLDGGQTFFHLSWWRWYGFLLGAMLLRNLGLAMRSGALDAAFQVARSYDDL